MTLAPVELVAKWQSDETLIVPGVRADTTQRGCNPGMVDTGDGIVVIDTPQLPSQAIALRNAAEAIGPIRYLVNTEHHIDHIFGNYFFKGAGTVINHQGVEDNFMTPTPDLDPFEFAKKSVATDDPDFLPSMPDRDEYYADPNRASIVLTGDATLKVGSLTFELLYTPGHTPGQLAVHIPEKRVVFTGDTIFSGCQTWLMESDVDEWLKSLDRLSTLDVDVVIPGHGPVTTPAYIAKQRHALFEWMEAVSEAVALGWTRDETIARVDFRDRYPVDVGLESMTDHIQTLNAASLWDKYSRTAN